MGKYFVWFPIIALVLIYILSVDCKRKRETSNKADHLEKLHVQHHHRAHKGKSVKRDLHKHYAQNLPLNPSERVLNTNEQPGFHVDIPILYGNSKKEKRQIQDDTSSKIVPQENITLDVTSQVLRQLPALEANITFNETTEYLDNKSQPLVAEGLSILTKIIDNMPDKNDQKPEEEYLTPYESKLKDTLSRIFDEIQENANLNDSQSKEPTLLESYSLDVQPVPQSKTDFNESKTNESDLIESRILTLQSILQSNVPPSEYNSNDSDSVKSRSPDVQPVSKQITFPDESNSKESDSFELGMFDLPFKLKTEVDLEKSMNNKSDLIETISSGVELVPQVNTAFIDSMSKETPLKESHSLDVYPKTVSQVNTDHKEIKNSDTSPDESQTFDVQPVSKGNTTISESSKNESLSLESNSLDLQSVSQEDTAVIETKSKAPIA